MGRGWFFSLIRILILQESLERFTRKQFISLLSSRQLDKTESFFW